MPNHNCYICNHRICSSAFVKTCSICSNVCHTLCLSGVSKFDEFYKYETPEWMCTYCIYDCLPFVCIDDENLFMETLLELRDDIFTLSLQELNEKIFNPFELNQDSLSDPLMDVDPDNNYFSNLTISTLNSEYYLEDSFNNKCNELSISSKNFSMIHMNIRSAQKNLKEFEIYLNSLVIQFTVLALTETWFTDINCNLHSIEQYESFENHRSGRSGGGVALFVRKTAVYKARPDLDIFNEFIESKFVELDKTNFEQSKSVVIGVIYRPPNTDIYEFNRLISMIQCKVAKENKDCYLLGDYNINLLNVSSHIPSSDFLETVFADSFVPLINKPTRVCDRSATLIDNILTNKTDINDTVVGILYSDITDHYPIFCIDYRKFPVPKEERIVRRNLSQRNISKFKEMIAHTKWNDVSLSTDTQVAYSLFFNRLSNIYNECFPIRTIKKSYNNRKPWITECISKSINNKNKLMAKSKKCPFNHRLQFMYKEYKRTLQKTMRAAEKNHYDKLFKQHKCDLRKSWNIIKQIINRKKCSKTPKYFYVQDKKTDDRNEISDGFNRFYVNLGPSLAKKIPQSHLNPMSLLKDSLSSSIFLTTVNEEEIINIFKSMKSGSCGWDGLSPHIIKMTIQYFLHPLMHICNLSLLDGKFPNELKIAKVLPLYKGGDDSQLVNYRPVSVLPVFSKVLERLMYDRIVNFLNDHNILYKFQFGFRKDHSTSIALMILVDRITKALSEGQYVVGVFIDFSKAFDTVNHDILLQKLWHYGIRGLAYDWLSSYLNNRFQYVSFDGVESSYCRISCGVPQGSILGPLLFLIYINDMANVSDELFTLLFADDTNTFLTGNDVNQMIKIMNSELQKLVTWMQVNKLSLNVSKTHFIIFRSSKMKNPVFTERLTMNNVDLKQEIKTKFLGVIIDQKLSWGPHIDHIKSKASKGIGIICKTKSLLNVSTLTTLYNSFVYPYLNYATEIWGDTHISYLNILQKLQKKVLRIITKSSWYAHTQPLFEELNILNLQKIHLYKVGIIMFKVHRNMTPVAFSELFVHNHNIHSHGTRQLHKLHVPIARTDYMQRIITVKGVRIWNHLYNILPIDRSLPCFKFHLRKYLLGLHDVSQI